MNESPLDQPAEKLDGKNLLYSIQKITLEGSKLALSHFGHASSRLKVDSSTVTEADIEVEKLLRERLHTLLPGAAFIGEESLGDPLSLKRTRESEWVWVVDPIDGTALFSSGLSTYAVCVGLLRNGIPWAGSMALPALGQCYSALHGLGAFLDDVPISVMNEEPPLDQDYLCLSRNAHHYLDVNYAGKVLCFGSTAYHFALVAAGIALGAVGRAHIWDHVATAAIIKEAGGKIRHLDGREVDWVKACDGAHFDVPLAAASPVLWDRMVKGVSLRESPKHS
mgnify:CR=1 FL=1|jgi:myo-inositol-1(or 4)-monophosphatase